MSLLYGVQQASGQFSIVQAWLLVALCAAIVVALVAVVYYAGHSDGRRVERDEDLRFGNTRGAIDGLIDDAEREIRRHLWRKP